MISLSLSPQQPPPPVETVEELRFRLLQLRQKRRKVAACRQVCQEQQERTRGRLNQLRRQRQEAVEAYQSRVLQRHALTQYLQLATRWNVINDCFHIWHAGPWGAINGARLGGEAPKLPAGLSTNAPPYHRLQETNKSPTPDTTKATTAPAPRRYLLWSSNAAQESQTNSTTQPQQNQPAAQVSSPQHHSESMLSSQTLSSPIPPERPPKVPWQEINAALGYSALLLKVLEEQGKANGGIALTHEIVPMGSSSQIGIRRGGAVAVYNLYFEESSFTLFKASALRNFNAALIALVQCLVQMGRQQTDKTIAMPHSIQLGNSDPVAAANNPDDCTIGGVPLAYSEATAVEFTRACKYLLTNMKWLIAYSVKHHAER